MEGHGGGYRAEAERLLYTANRFLTARDLHGARTFAIRARESDPRFDATDLILVVIDTLLAADTRINGYLDCYSILQVIRYSNNIEHIADQYRRLATLLDPHRNPFSFSGHASSLVHDAWTVLSNPTKKAIFDNQLRLLTQPSPPSPPPPPPLPPPPPPPIQNPRVVAEEERQSHDNVTEPTRTSENETFWTACPYCYVMYEYPKEYEECTLLCHSCQRGFHAVVIRSPPLTGDGEGDYFCTWGFFPLGFSGNFKDISGSSSNWNPFSPLIPCPLNGTSDSRSQKRSWVYHDDEAAAAFVELSDPSEEDSDDGDWRDGNRKKPRKKRRRKGRVTSGVNVRREPIERPRRGIHSSVGHGNVDNGEAVDGTSVGSDAARPESSKKALLGSSRRRAEGNLGKLDLNVEFSNEVEEPGPKVSEGNGNGNPEDNIEGISFFEGLDEFLSSLPILNVVADNKVKGQ